MLANTTTMSVSDGKGKETMKMKLICPQCKEVNKFTVWQVVNEKGFLCEHCGFYMQKSNLAKFSLNAVIFLVILVGGPLIASHCFYEISSRMLKSLFAVLVISLAILILLPLIALLMCSVMNYRTRSRHQMDKDM